MRHGILHADAVTTVSLTYAREIRTPEGGHGLDGDLRWRSDAVHGILNGVDYDDWNPAADRYLPFRYAASSLAGKARNKEALLDLLRMPAASSTPLLGMVTPSHAPEGHRSAVRHAARTAAAARDPLRGARHWRGPLQAVHGIAAGTLPGQGRVLQRIRRGTRALHRGRLGHVPDALALRALRPQPDVQPQVRHRADRAPHRRLADSVQHFDPATGQGTGVVFNDFDAGGLRWAITTALEWFSWPSVWRRLVQNGMSEDFSWEVSAAQYEKLYDALTTGVDARLGRGRPAARCDIPRFGAGRDREVADERSRSSTKRAGSSQCSAWPARG